MSETMKFRRLGTMIDCSRNAVMKLDAVKKWIDITADLGYNTLSLYLEETYELDGEPYFGHLRGRYSQEELRQIDDYAYSKGMEVIPCIQTLAHLNALFHWPVYQQIRDTTDILLAGDDRVYELVDKMFATFKKTLRTSIINIGMDEAHMLGRGQYLDRNGLRDRFDILMTHLNRVSALAEKYGFQLLMWGDMFFRIATGGDYYADHVDISEKVKAQVPANVKLVYWDYYSLDPDHYERQIDVHAAIKEDIWFAGGLWTWAGFAPRNAFSIESMGLAMDSCLRHGVQDVFMTLWGDDGSECSKFAILPSLYYVAERAKGNEDLVSIKAGFESKFGIPFDAFMLLDLPGTPNAAVDTLQNPNKYMLYCDCFLGQFDNRVVPRDADAYRSCADALSQWENAPEYGYLFQAMSALCQVLAIKVDLGVRTRRAYLGNDRAALTGLVGIYDELLQKVDVFYEAHRQRWMVENKPFGFDVQDLRIGGLIQRIRYCRHQLTTYLDGSLERIEELEAPVLDYQGDDSVALDAHYCNVWGNIATANTL